MFRSFLFALILVLTAPAAWSQTYFEPAAGDVYSPGSRQKKIGTSTDIAVIALPAAALIGILAQKDWQGLIQGVETAGATAAATLILKYAVKERRPDGSNMHSFPSGHTSVSFATAGFLQRRYGWKVGAPAYAIAAYVGWGRVYAKKHHWWDVVAGGAIGAGCAYIFTTPFAKKHKLSLAPVYDGTTAGMTAYMEF
ncbi:MAG: phosphatase PAP2 family protein [Muribaculaceae bacterium]|nr:phosphatase PAP2 family protein [Muribaculaceae bacterium]